MTRMITESWIIRPSGIINQGQSYHPKREDMSENTQKGGKWIILLMSGINIRTKLPLHLITSSNFMSEFTLEGVYSRIQLGKRGRTKKGE